MFIDCSYCRVEVSFGNENVFLVFLLSFQGSGLVTQKKYQERPKGEAAKQRAPEPPLLPLLARKGQHEDLVHCQKRHCHKMVRKCE